MCLGGMGGVAGAVAAPGGRGMAGTAEEAMVRPAFGGAGMVGGAPAAVGRGLGGRLIMAASRGLAAPGLPSRRGGRTMRTVSFFGSFMVGDASAGDGLSLSPRQTLDNCLLAKGCQIFHSDRGIFVVNFDLELAPGWQPVHGA